LTAATLAQHDLTILAQTPLTSDQAITLTNYVSGGGRCWRCGRMPRSRSVWIGAASGVLNDGYLKINDSANFDALRRARGWSLQHCKFMAVLTSTACCGRCVMPNFTAMRPTRRLPGCGRFNYGRASSSVTYDLAQNVIYTRQGNPANANIDVDGDGITRTIDLLQTIAAARRGLTATASQFLSR